MSKETDSKERFVNLVNRLPFVMGATASTITGIISYNQFGGTKGTYLRMAVGMVVFYILGVYIRSSLKIVNEEIEEKKRKEEEEKLESERAAFEAQYQKGAEKGNTMPSKLDIKVDDSEEFQPITVRQVVRNNMPEQDK